MVQVDRELIRLSTATAAEQRIRGADALYVALALSLSVPLVTWHREQRKRGSRIIRAITPEEALPI